MNTYYVDLINGDPFSDGMHIENPRKYYQNIALKSGDIILFKRGTFVRAPLYTKSGAPNGPITYGAYGEGKNPVFCGSINISQPEYWVETQHNIWMCIHQLPSEVCNFVFNNGAICGTLRWEKEELSEQGDFWDSRFGNSEQKIIYNKQCVLMYSEINPAEYYSDIECVVYGYRKLAELSSNMIIRDIDFVNSGVHALAGFGSNIHIKNCGFYFIGGGVWSKKLKIRFGNGVEFFNIANNISVEDSIFYDIYDSGVTHQGDAMRQIPINLKFDNNLFIKCGMAAYEGRDFIPQNLSFSNNICIEAGEGFSKLGVKMPRLSEIWPKPMGHHIFLWRMEQATENGCIEILNNQFGSAPYGAIIYSVISKEAEQQIYYSNNKHFGHDYCVPVRWSDTDFYDFLELEKQTGIKIINVGEEISRSVKKWLVDHNRI